MNQTISCSKSVEKNSEYTKSRLRISSIDLSFKFCLVHLGNVERSSDNKHKKEQQFSKLLANRMSLS